MAKPCLSSMAPWSTLAAAGRAWAAQQGLQARGGWLTLDGARVRGYEALGRLLLERGDLREELALQQRPAGGAAVRMPSPRTLDGALAVLQLLGQCGGTKGLARDGVLSMDRGRLMVRHPALTGAAKRPALH